MGFFYFIGSCGAENWDYTEINTGLLEIIGRGYVIEHCISLFNKKIREERYKVYVSDTLKLINDNLAKAVGGNVIKARYAELLDKKKEDTRTGDEVARDVIKRAGLKLKEQL